MMRILILSCSFIICISVAESQTSIIADTAKNSDGSVKLMNYQDALDHCTRQEMRLPSARELAELSQSLGAKGIKETIFPNTKVNDEVRAERTQNLSQGYYAIYSTNAKGEQTIDFYFSESGYQKPSNELGEFWFWSSSHISTNKNVVYGLSGSEGFLGFGSLDPTYVYFAVRCAKGI